MHPNAATIDCTAVSDCLVSGGKRCVDGFSMINRIAGGNSYHDVINAGADSTGGDSILRLNNCVLRQNSDAGA